MVPLTLTFIGCVAGVTGLILEAGHSWSPGLTLLWIGWLALDLRVLYALSGGR